jgi:adenylyltransferase/sulfurtransferase
MGAELRSDQFERYRRHLTLPEVGVEGQRKLLDARVLLVGAGGLGCPTAQYLAAAGVGTLGLVDADHVDASNLQRQILYGTPDLGRAKVEVARERLERLNPDVKLETHALRLTSKNALELLAGYDVIVDGSDNFPTRYLVNDACVLLGKPNVHGSILRFDGQAAVFDARRGPCYRCLYPEPPPPEVAPSCAEAGVLGVLPGLIALVQATETLKLVLDVGDPLIGRLLQIDALEMRFTEFRVPKDPGCPVCGERPSVTELIDYEGFCSGERPRPTFAEMEVEDLAALRARGEEHLLLDVRESAEYERARIEGARLLPLGELEQRAGELADWKERRIVVYCHFGGRSARACRWLLEHGFARVENVKGGIDAWSARVDAGVPRY